MSCEKGMCGKGCGAGGIAKILVIIGAINWGIMGIAYFFGADVNIVNMILGSLPALEAIVYILVGIAGAVMIFGCPCGKCKGSECMGGTCSGGTCGGDMPKM